MWVQRWNDIEAERMNTLVGRKVMHTQNMTMAQLTMAKGAVVPEHHHINEQITTVVQGKLAFFTGGKETIVQTGESLVIPPDVPHRVEALDDTVAIDIFAPVREDWLKGDDSYLRR
jgi:quercetin dioxygenase-like cupin family protein